MQLQPLDASTLATPSLDAQSSTASSSQAATASSISSSTDLGNETTFLQLLVAQIQNQDPTAPMDTTTFLTQLAQFSQLEQLIGIRQGIQQLDSPPASSASATPPASSTSGN